jgi:hypothetical protein
MSIQFIENIQLMGLTSPPLRAKPEETSPLAQELATKYIVVKGEKRKVKSGR